jgi:hypothetical protein
MSPGAAGRRRRAGAPLAILGCCLACGLPALALASPAPAASPLTPPTPPITVSVALPGGALTVGQRAEALITLRVPAAQLAGDPRFPVWRDAWGDAEVREHGEPRRSAGPDGTTVYSQRLVLAAFRPGKVELPPLPIAVPLRAPRPATVQARTPDHLALTVRSVLPADAKDKDLKPRPPAPLRRLPLGLPFFAALAALLAAAALGLWLLWRRRQRRRAAAPAAAPLLAPYAELLAALDRLERDSLGSDRAADRGAGESTPGDRSPGAPAVLALHTGLSQALRRYLGRSWSFPAPESTTSEIQRRLVALGWPSPQVRAAVELLRACDMVKFARAGTAGERGRDRLAAARRLAEESEARAAAEPSPARLEAAG